MVVAVVVFVAIGIAVEVVFLPKASQTPTTTNASSSVYCSAGCPTPSTTVKAAVDTWVSDFNTRNVQGMGGFYSPDTTVVWSGQASGLAGTYNGQGNVRILFGSSIGKTIVLNASINDYSEKLTNPSNANVTFTVVMSGNSSVVGTLSSTVLASQQWVYSGGAWQIIKENWNYQTFIVQYPVSATTFPQWAALKTGNNPALVSEKAFEWNAGPWVAASVYSALFAVLAIGVIKYRGRSRSDRLG